MQLRTDLAVEEKEIAGDEELSGVVCEQTREAGIEVTRITIKSDKAGRMLHKRKGTYITAELPALTDNFTHTDERVKIIGSQLRRLLPVNGLVLVAGLGNTEITADSLGPKAALGVLATRHINGELARSTGLDRLRSVAVLVPGVTGQTGIETGEYLLSIVKRLKPSAVIAIDALASRRLERLGTTLQISDSGISPGAGVGNHRTEINKDTLGVPVIAVGIPTVVDAVTLAVDLMGADDEKKADDIDRRLSPQGRKMVVTPKEIDLMTERGARLISMAVNIALQSDLSPEEIAMLVS